MKALESKVAVSAIIGGTASELTGGKFVNGAVSGSMTAALTALKDGQISPRRDVEGERGGIDAPTESLKKDLALIKQSGVEKMALPGLSEAVNRVVAAAIKFFDVEVSLGQVEFQLFRESGAELLSPTRFAISPKEFVTFGNLGSTLLHEAVHVNGAYFSVGTLGNAIQEFQAYSLEVSLSGRTGINSAPVNAAAEGFRGIVAASSPAALSAINVGNFDLAFAIDNPRRVVSSPRP